MSEDADLEKMLYLNAMKATLKVLNELETKNFNKKNDVAISDIEKKKKNDITCKTRVFNKRRDKENTTDVVGSKNSSKKKNDDEKPIEKVKRLKKENGVDERAQAPGRKRSTDHPRIERRRNEDISNIKSMTKRSQMYSKDDSNKRSSFGKKTVEIDRKSKSSRIDRRKMDKKMKSKAPAEKIKTIAKRNEIRLRNELKAHFDKIANNRMCTACNVLYKTCEHGREVNMEEIKEIEDVVSYKLRNHDYNWGDDVSDIDDDTEISECNLSYGYNKGWSRTNTNCDELVNEEKEEFLPKNFDGLSQVKKLKVLDELREANAFQSCGFKEMNGKAFSEYQLKKIGRSYAITSLINEVSNTKNKRIMGDCRSYYELNYENGVPKRIKKEDNEAFDIFTLDKEVKQDESNKDSANNEIIDENRFESEINSIFMENEGSASVSNQNDVSNNMDWDSKELLYQSNKRGSMAKDEIKTAQEVKNLSFKNIAEVAQSITKEPEESKNVYLSVDKNSVFYKNECYGQSENRMEENNERMMNQQVEIKSNMRGAVNFIAESKIKNAEDNEKHVESLAVTNDELMTALEKNNEHGVVDPIQKMDIEMEERVRDRMASLERNIRTRSINLMNELQCITMLMKKMLTILGIPYIDAPYESDSQLGYLNNECELERNERKSVFNPEEKCEHLDTNQVFNDKIYNLKVDAIITEDNDVFLFGANRVYKDYFKCPKLYTMQNIRDRLNLNREDLIKLSVFLGNDYTVGFRGIGPKRALEILKDEDKANYDRKVFDSEYSKVKNVYYKSIVDKKPLKLRSSRKLSEIRKFLSDNFLNDNQINEIVFYLRKINSLK